MTDGRAQVPPILVVNADDFGISEGVNRAIVEGHRHGILTSASVLATGCAFEHAVAVARETPTLGVGVHLCLHSERPVLPAACVTSLTDGGGRLRGPGEMARALFTRSANLNEVRSELEAQVGRVRDAGIGITHMDSHSHLHVFPGMGPIVRDLAARFGVRWVRRVAASPSEYVGAPWGRIGTAAVLSSLAWVERRHYGQRVRMPDSFFGLTRSGRVDEAWVCRTLARLRPGTISELMVHPGDGSPETGNWRDHDAAARAREAAVLRSPVVIDLVRSLGVRLSSFRDLPR